MNKLFLVALVAGVFASSANASMSYECWMYKDGKPWVYTMISANSKVEAESKAVGKFRELGRNGDYIKCK